MEFEDFFDEEYPRLVRALGVAFDPESAADAVQDAFVVASRRWATLGGYDEPAAWVRRVALNRLKNGQRNQRRRAEILASIRPATSPEADPRMLDLKRAVDQLPRAQRLAVCLYYLADASVEQISVALGVAPGTVKSNLHDGRARLRLALEDSHA